MIYVVAAVLQYPGGKLIGCVGKSGYKKLTTINRELWPRLNLGLLSDYRRGLGLNRATLIYGLYILCPTHCMSEPSYDKIHSFTIRVGAIDILTQV